MRRYTILAAVCLSIAWVQIAWATSPAWMNNSWLYRVPVTISNSGSAQSQLEVNVSLTSSFQFALSKSDGSDLRVTDSDGVTMLPFWIEKWNSVGQTASVWVKQPSTPSGTSTIWLYYGNPSATSTSNGNGTFEFFDDFEGPTTSSTGYYQFGPPTTALIQDQGWETAAPHTLSVLPYNSGGYAYWGWYGLQATNGGCGLAQSNDLATWTKYASNPLFLNCRWPSVTQVSGTLYMAYTYNYAATPQINLAESTDGINWTQVKTLVSPVVGFKNQGSWLMQNPTDGLFYMYYYTQNNSLNDSAIKVRKASTIEGLDTATDTLVLYYAPPSGSNTVIAMTSVVYLNNTYYMAVETQPGGGVWTSEIYSSPSPMSGFVRMAGNPILSNGAGCLFQFVFSGTLYGWTCQDTGGTWTLTEQSSSLSSGLTSWLGPDGSKWTPSAEKWEIATATLQDGSTGKVLRGTLNNLSQILQSSFSGTDYVFQAQGNQASGTVWGLGIRAADFENEDTVNLYDNHNGGNNLYTYKLVNNVATQLGAKVASSTINTGIWYKLAVKVHGSSIDAYFNDALVSSSTDSTYTSGTATLYGQNGTVAEFNDVLVRKYVAADPISTIGLSQSLLPAITFGGGIVLGGGIVIQ